MKNSACLTTNDSGSRPKAGVLLLILLLSLAIITALPLGVAHADTLTATIPAGSNLGWVGVNPTTNMVYVSNTNSNGTVTVINGTTNSVTATIAVGSYPRGVGVNPVTNRIYVGNQISNTVSVIDGSTNTVIDTIGNVRNPWGVAVNANTNSVYVVNNPSNLTVIDGTTDTITARVSLPTRQASHNVAVNPNTDMVYVTSTSYSCYPRCHPIGFVSVINGTTNTLVKIIEIPTRGVDVTVNPNTNIVYATSGEHDIYIIDGGTNNMSGRISGVGGYGVAVNPTTNKVYSTDFSSALSVINGTTNAVLERITVGSQPLDIDINSNTNMIYVANSGSSTVSVVDGSSSPPSSTTSQLTINTQDTNGSTLIGYWTQLYQNGVTIAEGYTPYTYTLVNGQTYTVEVDGWNTCSFDHWLDNGSTNNIRDVSITSDTSLTGVLNCGTPSPQSTSTAVTPNPASTTTGSTITFTATVTDTSSTPSSTSGTLSWSDGGKGGSFSSSGTCTLTSISSSQGGCSTTYTAPATAGSVTIAATYSGDSTHVASSGTSSLTVTTSGGTSQLTVNTQDTTGKTLTGFWTELHQNGQTIATGYTPATYILTNGQAYVVEADGYGSCSFAYWLDTGSTNNQRTISITSDTSLTAVLRCVP